MDNVFALEKDKLSVKLIETDTKTISSFEALLDIDTENYKAGAIRFDGSYKPEKDECLKIDKFILPDDIREAVSNPLGVDRLRLENNDDLNIRAIFTPIQADDADEKIVFQRTQKNQVLIGGRLLLFFDKGTFTSTEKPAIVITDSIDAFYENETLYFKSYYWANQIFNLNKYYREATDDDIKKICTFRCIHVKDIEMMISASNNWTRRKIAYILDSKVLENNSYDNIMTSAQKLGLKFENDGDKIIFPEDITKQKELLSYLADEIYKGSLTDDIYLTNSKRTLK